MFVYVCVCMHVFGGPHGPVLMSYLCAFLTRAWCSAHGTVILGRGWPCSAARLCRLLYLWHQHLAVCLSVCIHQCVHGRRAGEQGAHSGSKYCVYQHNESSGREGERKRNRERGQGMEKAILPLLLFPPGNQPLWCLSHPPSMINFPLVLRFPPFMHLFLFAWRDKITTRFSATMSSSKGWTKWQHFLNKWE